MQIPFAILMFILGAGLGSFLCCQARRLSRRESHLPPLGPRSVCPHCQKQLKWYENLPLLSWLLQKGRCRSCGKKIGLLEILSEIATAIALALLTTTLDIASATPLQWATFALTALLTLVFIFLAIYDAHTGELPSFALILALIIAIIIAVVKLASADFALSNLITTLISGAILGGLYLVLLLVSKGHWVGDGDWLLALAIGLVLGSPLPALIALFLANFSATIVMAPTAIKHKKRQIFFGPFLVFAFVVTLVIASYLPTL